MRTIDTELPQLLGHALAGLGYELVDFEHGRSGLMRVFIDRQGGITVDDCARVSNHLTRLFAVENVAFDRLEISSPGLDRALKKAADFARFTGQKAKVHLFALVQGRKRFVGRIAKVSGEQVSFVLVDDGKEGAEMTFALSEIERARLVPDI